MRSVSILAMVFFIVAGFTGLTMAQENLDDWVENVSLDGGGQFTSTTMGTSAQLTASGDGGWAWGNRSKEFTGALGMLATVNVAGITGEAQAGIRQYIGTLPNENRVLIQVGAYQNSTGSKAITYSIRERDDGGTTIREFANGALGAWDGAWSVDQPVVIACLLFNNEIWFAASSNAAFVKVQPFEMITPYSEPRAEIYAYANSGAANTISATISNVNILK